jgi:murein L,D-transpeptidase YcbB/YkuD
LQSLWPQHDEYLALIAKRVELSQLDEPFTEIIPSGPLLRQGDKGPRVQQLYTRLSGPGEHPDVFDAQLGLAVKQFQRAAGLEADGIVGEGTLEILNSNRFSWIDRVDANLERWRWLPRQLPATYIRVNIAAFRLRGIEDNRQALAMDVIVGRPYRQTPIFTGTMKYLVFFPFWNVPTSIAIKDKLPLLRENPELLALLGYEAKLAGSEEFAPVQTIDWPRIKPGGFLLRQKPGEQNALGKVKFMFPNIHDVYLHDTPDKALFKKTERTFSSGCIRVADAPALVEWLTRRDGNFLDADLPKLLTSGPTTTLYLAKPVPVYLVYFTAFVDDGSVVFRRDIYNRDQRIIDELRHKEVLQ